MKQHNCRQVAPEPDDDYWQEMGQGLAVAPKCEPGVGDTVANMWLRIVRKKDEWANKVRDSPVRNLTEGDYAENGILTPCAPDRQQNQGQS
jgi:hypothetical protein